MANVQPGYYTAPFLQVKPKRYFDPVNAANYDLRQRARIANRLRYGQSVKALVRRIEKARDAGVTDTYAHTQLSNRLADQYVGRGRYRRRRRYMRGRGSYWGGFKKLRHGIASGARTVNRVNRSLAPGAASLALLAGQPEIAAGIEAASMGLDATTSVLGGTGMYTGATSMMSGPMLGRGSYTVGNSLIDGLGSSIPTFETTKDETGALVVTHTEFIKDVYGNEAGVNFANTGIELNPGLTASFPFLSQIAANFEEYEFVQLLYCYKPKLSQNISSSDGQVGTILMTTDYNADDAIKQSKQQMMQTYGTSNGRVVDRILHGVECDPSKIKGDGHKYIRVRGLESGKEKSDYDAGVTQIAVVSTPTELQNEVLGELYVSYRVVLRKPRVFSLYGFAMDRDEFILQDSHTNMLNCEVQAGKFNSIGCAVRGAGSGHVEIIFPASFAGTVEVKYHKRVATGTLGTTGNDESLLAGNVSIVTLPSTVFDSTEDVDHHQIADNLQVNTFQQRFRIEQAESGQDNEITLRTRFGSNENTRMILTISRVNAFEKDSSQEFELVS